ncbi:CiaD-like domain-containing protein [Helicobacter equorum]|uniref:CiaD-like domain-containing protein n=1 Tax=Helicobacter equorum TaxID=361872 RepID=UPI000CF0E1C9|nr:hypothetical protein [Helicobacter equorum]
MELKDIILETINTLEGDNTLDTPADSPTHKATTQDSHIQTTNPTTSESTDPNTAPMDLKTLSTMLQGPFTQDKVTANTPPTTTNHTTNQTQTTHTNAKTRLKPSMISVINESHNKQAFNDEKTFLKLLQDRLLVLFEGLSMPQQDPQKLTMVLNFLQYQLSVIAKRLENLEDTSKKGL